MIQKIERIFCIHVHDTRASLARTIPNVTILWGSWHWAVSGPIGPNLPVFHHPNRARRLNDRRGRTPEMEKGSPEDSLAFSRVQAGRSSRDQFGPRSTSCPPRDISRAVDDEVDEGESVPGLALDFVGSDRGPDESGNNGRAWERNENTTKRHVEQTKAQNKKRESLGPTFPSEARHLGPVWPPVWINVISRSRSFLPSPFLFSTYLPLFLTLSLSLPHFHSLSLALFLSLSLSLSRLLVSFFFLYNRYNNRSVLSFYFVLSRTP